MNMFLTLAVTWFGQEHRFLGLDWSYLVVLGVIGNATFSMRFLVQWLASERQGESVIVFRRDPVGILAYLPNSIICIRNLMLIRQRKFAFSAAASSQGPRETGLRRTASSASAHVGAIAASS